MATQRKKKSAPKKTTRGKKVAPNSRRGEVSLKDIRAARRIQKDLGPLKKAVRITGQMTKKDGWVFHPFPKLELAFPQIPRLPDLSTIPDQWVQDPNGFKTKIEKAATLLVSQTQEACEKYAADSNQREVLRLLIIHEARKFVRDFFEAKDVDDRIEMVKLSKKMKFVQLVLQYEKALQP